jgi:hypothetical protein
MTEESTLVVVEETSILQTAEGELLVSHEENTTILAIGIQGAPGVDGSDGETIESDLVVFFENKLL